MVPKLRVLVVDDSVVCRRLVSEVLSGLPETEVAGVAADGRIALAKVRQLKPDLLVLDLEMPGLGGLEVLAALAEQAPDVGAIVLAAPSASGGDLALRALHAGAFDFVPKPWSRSYEETAASLRSALAPKIAAYAHCRAPAPSTPGEAETAAQPWVAAAPLGRGLERRPVGVVGIGVSTGGPNALAQILPALPADLGVPILVVQHLPALFTRSLAERLAGACALDVREAADGEPLAANTIRIAPGARHLTVDRSALGRAFLRVSDGPPENGCKPSADVLFRSLAVHFPGAAAGVILTGMGADGTQGLGEMHRSGCPVIAQDEASCVVYGMPREAVRAGVVDVIAPLGRIAAEICRSAGRSC